MRFPRPALAVLSSIVVATPAASQHATTSVAANGYAPEVAPVTVAATSTPATWSTSSPITVELVPQLGRPIRLVAKLIAGTSFSAQIFTSPDRCVTLNPLTVVGQTWASYPGATGPINEDVDVPMIVGISYCATIVPGSGATVIGGLSQ